ncbi:MAG TPA: cyclic nucleotide-binding domain-containing protein [Microthrixaceae bacterium]|nr:cyclic nucleotide-binding domain-containing protein [Microthrixaceae bacterium]
MRIEREVLSLSWIPSEAVGGAMKLSFDLGLTHYDEPPPDHVDDVDALRGGDRFRFANRLRAWIDVDDGEITGAGYSGGVLMGTTTLLSGHRLARTFQAIDMPVLQAEPEMGDGTGIGDNKVRFVQTAGGRPGMPSPRRVNHAPFFQWKGPLVWTTLGLTIHTDGHAELELLTASQFPRHWVYDTDGALALKSGTTDFNDWYHHAFGTHSPWGDEDSPAVVAAAETALERKLSTEIMRGGEKPEIRKVKPDTAIMTEGQADTDLFLLLDGVVRVDVGGEPIAELGPGAVFGERALLEGGTRTATIVAVTDCRVAVVRADQVATESLTDLADGHRREENAVPGDGPPIAT